MSGGRLARIGRRTRWCALVGVLAAVVAGCSSGGSADAATVVVRVGYQSKTINTVNAGTLLREQGTFERKLAELGATTGRKYQVEWQDFPRAHPSPRR
ncbi:hypothetical protein ACFQV8_04045 [Pseudonocardia benzenivorans]